MSNLSRTSKKLKKKLSFADYSKPVNQHDVKIVDQLNCAPVEQHTSKPTYQQQVPTGTTVSCHTSKKDNPQPANTTCRTVKATYYLTAQENDALTEIYIKRMQEKNKTDKSALIGKAIQLLHKQEMG